MSLRNADGLPTELVLLILTHAVRHFLVEHPATAVAIARVSRTVYDLIRPALYRSFVGRRPNSPECPVQSNIGVLSKSNQVLVQRLFVAPFTSGVLGLDGLINIVEIHAPWKAIMSHDQSWAANIVRAVICAPLGEVAVDLTMNLRSSVVFPNLTHLTLLAVAPRAGNMMGWAIDLIVPRLKCLTHFGLDMGNYAYLRLGRTGARDNITDHVWDLKQYAINATIALEAALEYGLIRRSSGRKPLQRVALRVPKDYVPLWEQHMLPRIVRFVEDNISNQDLEVIDRLLVWCETRVCDNFAQRTAALQRDFLAEKDLWSEAIPFGSFLTVLG